MNGLTHGVGALLLYFLIAAGIALACRATIRIPDELFRKILHCILLGSLPVFLFAFRIWWDAALTAVGFAVVVYPILAFFERFRGFSQLTTERKHGELKASLLLVFGMFACVIAVCWGWLGDRYLALASIYAWGFGDAAAALIGKRFGVHKIGKKSIEGSAAMFLTAFLSVLAILLVRGGMPPLRCILVALGTAAVSAQTELYSKNGMDTVICPLSSMVVLIPLVYLAGGFV